ncbi:MAG: 3-oxoadipate enol-lactonase [Methylocella sp.]
MSEITIAGETFNVRLEGDENKEVLALAHQLGGSLAVWEPLMPALLEHFRVLRWDSRGHGGSIANEGPYSVAQLARDAIAIFDALGIEKAHWLGLSMGAIVGQAALIAAPERIGRAVLANTAAKLGTPDIWNARIQATRQDGMEAIAGTTAARWFTPEFREAEPEDVEAVLFILRETSPEGYAAASAALRDVDQREAIRSIRNKALVIVGRHDPSAPPELGAFVASAIKGARLMTLESSHISPIEQADAFAEAAIDFLTAPETPLRKPPAPRKTPARRARQLLARRTPAKAPAKKAAVKKAAVKKAPEKTTAKKTAAKKTPVRKGATKQGAVKKAATKKAPVAKSPVKKSTPKVPVKKAAAKKGVVKKGAVAKPPVKAAKSKPAATKKPAAKAASRAAGKTRGSKGRPARKNPR